MRSNPLVKSLNRTIGPSQRILMAVLSLCSPGELIFSAFIGFTEAIDEMDDNQIKAIFDDE